MRVRHEFAALIGLAAWLAAATAALAEKPVARPTLDAVRAEVAEIFASLDHPRYGVRTQAAEQFERLLNRPELTGLLAVEVQRHLLEPKRSFEVRWRLERWAKQLPVPPTEPPSHTTADEIDRVVSQLDDDDYGVRRGALGRLRWMLSSAELIEPAMVRLKQRLADPSLAVDPRQRYESAYQAARSAWLLSPLPQRQAPSLSDETLHSLIDAIVERADSARPADRVACRAAERELLDAMAFDADVQRIADALQDRLSKPLDTEAHQALDRLWDLTRPAMVAEYWSGRHHQMEQHLLIGVPSQSPGAVRPSHFDYIDDERANCVSGNRLSPGIHPANVAFPHPLTESAFFQLVNLSTPRRRMAYSVQVNGDETLRLAALSRRTLDRFLRDKRELSEAELVMLAQLDAKEVSRFAGAYFRLVDDSPLPDTEIRERLGGRPSRHGLLCGLLATEGAKEAAPGLIEAIAQNRFRPPTAHGPYRMHWVAALALAARDPWPDLDAWLAAQVAHCEMLAEDQREDGAEVGATAAALLLRRTGERPAHHGLQLAPDAVLVQCGLDGYRFMSTDARWKLIEWWKTREAPNQRP
jgi:hypothetical protein